MLPRLPSTPLSRGPRGQPSEGQRVSCVPRCPSHSHVVLCPSSGLSSVRQSLAELSASPSDCSDSTVPAAAATQTFHSYLKHGSKGTFALLSLQQQIFKSYAASPLGFFLCLIRRFVSYSVWFTFIVKNEEMPSTPDGSRMCLTLLCSASCDTSSGAAQGSARSGDQESDWEDFSPCLQGSRNMNLSPGTFPQGRSIPSYALWL